MRTRLIRIVLFAGLGMLSIALLTSCSPANKGLQDNIDLSDETDSNLTIDDNDFAGTIIFERRAVGEAPTLFTINSFDNNATPLAGTRGYLASWSPDGQQIAFVNSVAGANELFSIDSDGQNQSRLTYTSNEEGIPAWSPDRSQITLSLEIEGNLQLISLDAVTGDVVVQLSNEIGRDSIMAAWSPNGEKLLYVSSDGTPENMEIFLMDSDGSNATQLTNNDVLDFYPAWHPSGTRFAFVSARSGTNQIYEMNLDGGEITQITDEENGASRPAWSPGGEAIAFHQFYGDDVSIYIVDVISGESRLLVSQAAHPAWTAEEFPSN
jgi:Tol biopolymer transport system component